MPLDGIVRALYAYEATDVDELSFDEDELLCIIKDKDHTDDSWLHAKSLSGDKDGLVPANYVEPVICFI